MKKIRNLAIAGVSAVLLVFAGAVSASADSTNSFSHGGYVRASASFKSSTGKLTVTDKRADGYWIRAQVDSTGFSGVKNCDNKAGNGGSVTCTYDVAKGKQVRYKLYIMNGQGQYVAGSSLWSDKRS